MCDIPIGEYAAKVAPSDSPAAHGSLEVRPGWIQPRRGAAYMQNHAEELQAEVERTLPRNRSTTRSRRRKAEAVRGEIKTQLDAAARFTPQVNDAYSSMWALSTRSRRNAG